MKILLSFLCLLLLAACGPSQEEKEKVAAVTCAIMSESKNTDSAERVREINAAREKIGAEPFLSGDYAIKEAFEWELCEALVLNDDYDIKLQGLKDAKAERERIAGAKPTVEEEFYASGKLKSRTHYQPKNDGGKKHGLSQLWYENGQLESEENYESGEKHGLSQLWHENGQLKSKESWLDGFAYFPQRTWHENGQLESEHDVTPDSLQVYKIWHENGQLSEVRSWLDGKKHGLHQYWYENGQLFLEENYENGVLQ